MNRSRTSSVVRAGIVLASVAALVGCGSDDPGESSSATTGPAVSVDPAADASTTTASTLPWPDQPDPCSLLTVEEIQAVVGFDVTQSPLDASQGGGPRTCAWTNTDFSAEGGSVTIRVLPPETDLAADRQAFGEPEDVVDLGRSAYVGAAPGALGPGTTGVVVDMGSGGFGLVISTFEVRTTDDALTLARSAAAAWPAS